MGNTVRGNEGHGEHDQGKNSDGKLCKGNAGGDHVKGDIGIDPHDKRVEGKHEWDSF